MRAAFLLPLLLLELAELLCADDARPRPLMRDFMAPGADAPESKAGLHALVVRGIRSHLLRWQGGTEEQRAAWSVRSLLVLARLGAVRAHPFFSNDKNEPRAKGGSGITGDFEPKPAFHALAWLQRSLGEYRFARADREEEECHAYEFIHGADPKKHAWVVWRAAGEPRIVRLYNDPQHVLRAERMPLVAGDAEKVEAKQEIEGYVAVEASERPVIIWMEKP